MVWVRSPVYIYKRKNTFYFSRIIPADVRHRFNKNKIEMSLRTSSEMRATKLAEALTDRLERHWDNLRLERLTVSGLELSSSTYATTAVQAPSLDEALELYLALKGRHKGKLFFQTSHRAVEYLKEVTKAQSIANITGLQASQFRDLLFKKGLTSSSVKRVFSTVRAIFNLSISEYGLTITNPFTNVFIPNDDRQKLRAPIPLQSIYDIQRKCFEWNDSKRWLVALISDTGMRLSEALGLKTEDIKLSATIPHIVLREYQWRSLKTSTSERTIPLIGASEWAARKIMSQNAEFAFPDYCNRDRCKSNSASAALNKWLKSNLSDEYVIHSFRHSMRDRLRAVECPSDIVDAIGGWATDSIGQKYGSGYPLEIKAKWMQLLENKSVEIKHAGDI